MSYYLENRLTYSYRIRKALDSQPEKHPIRTIESSKGYPNMTRHLSMALYSPIEETMLPSHARAVAECARNGYYQTSVIPGRF